MQFMMHGYAGSSFYRISEIKQMRHAWKDTRGGEHPASITFKDGREIRVHDTDIDRVVRHSAPITPALAGFELLSFGYMPGEDEGGPWIHREPIIGWREGIYGGLDPVIVDYNFTDLGDQHAILQPDGHVQAGERWFKSEADWIDCMKEVADHGHARAKVAEDAGGASGSPA